MKAIIIAVGNELVSGQIIDSNSAYLSARLGERGIAVAAHWTVPDDREQIASAIARAARSAGLVLVTGGIGPTADDLTRHSLADAMGVDLQINEECLRNLEAFFADRDRYRKMHPSNRVQAMIPAGAEPLDNRLGTAAGIAAHLGQADVYVMPGVPSEMRDMYDKQVASRLPSGDGVIRHRILHTFGAAESDIGAELGEIMDRGRNPLVGTTAAAGLVSVRIAASGRTADEADRLAEQTARQIRGRLGELVIGEGDETLASVVGDQLRRLGQTLATAESCTGGMLGAMLTDTPGASDYYLGGAVAYANRIKRDILGVDEALLEQFGAVSEQAAAAMADGCRERFAGDWAMAITGIAGPAGGTDAKPVGLIYIAVAGPDHADVHRHIFPGVRELVRRRAALAGLNWLRLALGETKRNNQP